MSIKLSEITVWIEDNHENKAVTFSAEYSAVWISEKDVDALLGFIASRAAELIASDLNEVEQ